jgi:addiction module HigA family antidote
MAIERPAAGWNIQRVTTHPGAMLREEFLIPLGISQNALALKMRVPATRIGEIVNGKRAITPDTALRLARFFGNSPEFWLNLQQMHDLSKARLELKKTIEREVEVFNAAWTAPATRLRLPPVVRHRDRSLSQRRHPVHQLGQVASPIQQRVLRMQMQMRKFAHSTSDSSRRLSCPIASSAG